MKVEGLRLFLVIFCLVWVASCSAPTLETPFLVTPTPGTFSPSITSPPITATPQTLDIPPAADTPSPTPEDAPALQFPTGSLIHDLRWSPDGSQLAIAAGTEIHLYDSASMLELFRFALGVWTERIAFHPSKPILGAAAKNGKVYFWDMNNGAEICRFTAHSKGANSLAFQANGNLLATTGTDIISRLWDISSVLAGGCDVKAGAFLIGSSYTAPDVTFSADGQMFALVDIKNIYLRESQTRKLIALLKSDLAVFDIALSPNGRWLAAAQGNSTLTLWDLAAKPKPTSTALQIPAGNPQTYVWRVDFSSESDLLAGATSNGALLVWALPGLQPVFSHKLAGAISGLAFKPKTSLLAVGVLDGSFYLYQINR